MLTITCKHEEKERVKEQLVLSLSELVKDTNFEALTFSYMDDDDLCGNISELFEDIACGFLFDRQDSIGEEPYGYVSCFFEGWIILLQELKRMFPDIGIEGEIFVNEYGVMDGIYRQRVHCTPDMTEVQFIDQLQCVHCGEWVDATEAAELFEDAECSKLYEMNEDFCMMPSCYHNSGIEVAFCACKKCVS